MQSQSSQKLSSIAVSLIRSSYIPKLSAYTRELYFRDLSMPSSRINPEETHLISRSKAISCKNPIWHVLGQPRSGYFAQDHDETVQFSGTSFMSRSQSGPWPPSFRLRAWGSARTGSPEGTGPGSLGFCAAPPERGPDRSGPDLVWTGTAQARPCSSPGTKEDIETPAAKNTHRNWLISQQK